MQIIKKRVINKYPYIIAVKYIVYYINLIIKNIISIE